jgi:hypothetical protein
MNRSPLLRVEEESRDLIAPVRARLAAFCGQADLHACFLNTLSLMEYIGSRKIMASQGCREWDRDTLKHLAEETRHAYFFKRAAERLARRPLDYSAANTISGAFARAYMGRLDAEITQEVGATPALPYLYMSLIVELRAVWMYGLYQEILNERGARLSLKSVLAEEELHLDSMLARLSALDHRSGARIAEFSTAEDARFRILWRAIEDDCRDHRLAAE